ncbi:MAG: hypothetical protein A2516_02705 [Alphaproteobacteria bacterium RIFOXYD12_FULL_60_8]|nr:MAG: hypothetical protein A2516_02705 [Alphaproteobacteria bacterium RIFOXYD12_FULL_60_8]
MAGRIEARLQELGISLPQPVPAMANYRTWQRTGNLVYVSGMIPLKCKAPTYCGQLGGTISSEEGIMAARLCGLNLIGQVREACDGDLDRVVKVVKLTGMVNSTPHFREQHKIMNGCSDLMVEVFGEDIGRHARAAFGCASLPFGAAVEADGIFEVK